MEIGAQLYTISDFCQSLESFEESLKKIADIGYKNIQVSGTCEFEPQWLAEQLKKNGLKCVLTHTPEAKLKADAAKVAKDHDVFDCKYVGLGWYTFNEKSDNQNFASFIKDFTPVADILAENGKYFMYHNHNHEFRRIDGKLTIERLEEQMAADRMGFTLDTYWVQRAGADPAYWVERLKGRVPCIHLKDCTFDDKMAVIGEGNINFERIFKKAEASGTEYMLVEQDDCYGEDPFDCLKRSYEYLKSRGFK